MSRWSVEDLVVEAGELVSLGVRALLLFGVPDEKDDEGSGAWDEDGTVQLHVEGTHMRLEEARWDASAASRSRRIVHVARALR